MAAMVMMMQQCDVIVVTSSCTQRSLQLQVFSDAGAVGK
jgi:hypothetical protein